MISNRGGGVVLFIFFLTRGKGGWAISELAYKGGGQGVSASPHFWLTSYVNSP